MFDLQGTISAYRKIAEISHYFLPMEGFPDLSVWAPAMLLGGLVLAFFGARLLRAVYILVFMVVGGRLGVYLAGQGQVDSMFGLIIGALVAAVIGYLLFRWWVGVTAGTLAVLILALLSGPKLDAELTQLSDYLPDATADYTLPATSMLERTPEQQRAYALEKLKDYIWKERADVTHRAALGLALVWILGVAVGVLLPKLTMVLGTSVIGVGLISTGGGIMVAKYMPEKWDAVQANAPWLAAAAGILLLAAISFQARGSRPPRVLPPPAPVAA